MYKPKMNKVKNILVLQSRIEILVTVPGLGHAGVRSVCFIPDPSRCCIDVEPTLYKLHVPPARDNRLEILNKRKNLVHLRNF